MIMHKNPMETVSKSEEYNDPWPQERLDKKQMIPLCKKNPQKGAFSGGQKLQLFVWDPVVSKTKALSKAL